MANLLFTLSVLMCLAIARCTNSKFVKTMPTITNSLVNLGKMDISIYFNGKHPEDPSIPTNIPFQPNAPTTRTRVLEAPCPCSSFKSTKDSFLSDPSDIINKILKSNDLFKDPTSTHCCDFHEQIQESTMYFELGPNRAPMTINNLRSPLNTMRTPRFPKVWNPQAEMLSMRPRAMEILLFPKRKDIANMDVLKKTTQPATKPEIQVVGDKQIKPLNEGASVKKDLTSLLENKDNEDDLKVEVPVTNVNNAL